MNTTSIKFKKKEVTTFCDPLKAPSETSAAVQPDPVYAHHQLLIYF